jgi:aminodeoxyfutalosine synthase
MISPSAGTENQQVICSPLDFGVDDVDCTVVWYDITKVEGRDTHQEVCVADLRRAIVEAGYEPIERDTLYRRVIRHGADWHAQSPACATA